MILVAKKYICVAVSICKGSVLYMVKARTKRADLQQICNRSVLTKTDQLQTTLSSADVKFEYPSRC